MAIARTKRVESYIPTASMADIAFTCQLINMEHGGELISISDHDIIQAQARLSARSARRWARLSGFDGTPDRLVTLQALAAVLGGKPSKRKLSVGRPETESAAITALAPGTGTTGKPASRHLATSG